MGSARWGTATGRPAPRSSEAAQAAYLKTSSSASSHPTETPSAHLAARARPRCSSAATQRPCR